MRVYWGSGHGKGVAILNVHVQEKNDTCRPTHVHLEAHTTKQIKTASWGNHDIINQIKSTAAWSHSNLIREGRAVYMYCKEMLRIYMALIS